MRKGSLTVQTHNYMIEAPPDGPRPHNRAIQFPIIQVNRNNNHDNNAVTQSLPAPALVTKSSFSKYSTSARIEEVDEEEEERFSTGMDTK